MTGVRALVPIVLLAAAAAWAAPERDAATFAEAVDKINAAHARAPGNTTEGELAKELPGRARSALERILKAKPSAETTAALVTSGEAALDLALLDDFAAIRERLHEDDPETAATLGDAVARERFLVRGTGEFEDGYLDEFADVLDAILDAYDEVFGFREWSKVPGKKIRVRLHLEDQIRRPPHFAPQFPYHSEIDFPVIDPKKFTSPTSKGQMLFYGICHELGHLIAMWGDRNTMEDHHAWAHYTGVVIVEHMSANAGGKDFMKGLRDVRWRSLANERRNEANQGEPSFKDRPGVMAFLIALHESAGPKAIGAAMNHLDESGAARRVNHVRYYRFRDLEKALAETLDDRDLRKELADLFP